MTRAKVVIVQRRLTHYRVPLFEGLRAALAAENIALELLIGNGTSKEEARKDAGELPWATRIPTYYFGGDRICYQRFDAHLEGADLVIVTQENKLINNYLLLAGRRPFRLAFWGHGANLQSTNSRSLRERIKRWTTTRVDWWFAYTTLSADLVANCGFPRGRVTVLNNAVDTRELKQMVSAIGANEVRSINAQLSLGQGPVGVFLGSLHEDKRLYFLVASAAMIHEQIPTFRLVLIGDGPESETVRRWQNEHDWIRWVGARRGREKVAYASLGQVMLNPGLVGLGLLDAFALGMPMVTTEWKYHSPEIAYLKNLENGIVAPNDTSAYACAVVNLLRDTKTLHRLREGCRVSANQYSIEDMTTRFAAGIAAAIESTV